MTTYGRPRVWLDQFPLGEPQPFERDYHGIRYPGEVIRADGWSPPWGEPLSGDAYFRIVLLSQRTRRVDPPVNDPRIVLCLPGTRISRQRGQVVDELATLKETQALYATQRDSEADLIRRTLQRRQEGLEDQLMAQEATRYASGAIVAGPERRSLPHDLFTGDDPAAWFSSIAGWLLAKAYPNLPVNVELLPRAVTQDDPGQLYRAIFAQDDASPDILTLLGPGLGLSSADNPGEFNASACPVLRLIRDRLSEVAQPASWPEIHHYLAHEIGLTRPLATLYLMVFLRQERPQLEVRLSPEHQLSLAGGRPLPGARLTSDLLPCLVWDPGTADWGATFGPETQPHWNDTLPYLRVLSTNLSPVAGRESTSPQEQRLVQDLTILAREITQAQRFLALLDQRAGAKPAASPLVREGLARLSPISGSDFRSIYQSVRHIYADYRLLEQDMALLGQLSQLARSGGQIQRAGEYLDQAAVPEEMADLSIEKQGLEAVLTPDSLLRFSRGWNLISRQVADFKTRYAAAYRAHHERINQSIPAYEYNLNSARLKLRALELLNTMPELGQPAGVELSAALGALNHNLSPCAMPPGESDLNEAPQCPSCYLTLEQTLPAEGLSRLLTTIDAALGEKNRQLSNLLVERILHGRVDQRLEDFLKIVQASDLSALSNTINEELVVFIRRMLG